MVFFWFFLAVQLMFLLWVINGGSSEIGTPTECEKLTGQAREDCENGGDVGTAIGAGLVIVLWAIIDIILGFTYLVYRLARRRR